MKGEKLSATKSRGEGVTRRWRDILRSFSLCFGHSIAMNTTGKNGRNPTMKTCLTIALSLTFATAVVHGQNLAAYQSVVTGQSPMYYNNLDNSLAPSIGTGTFVPTAIGTGFTNDYFGNANDAAYFTNTTAQLALAAGGNIINNSGSANSIGSLSLLFYAPNAVNSSTRYVFSDGDVAGANGNQYTLELVGQVVTIKAGNKTITTPWSVTPGTWYYFASTWDFSGANSSIYGLSNYLAVAGQPASTLLTNFTQRGGTGNISSTAIFGNGGTFTISAIQSDASGGFNVAGVPGLVDELATWNTVLTTAQIGSQVNALILVPEPSTLALCGSALMGLCAVARRRRALKK